MVIGDATLQRRVHGGFGDAGAGPLLLGVEEAEPGAGAGVVRALASLGVATAFICVLGDDLAGAQLTALVGAQSNVEPWLLVDGAKATTTETVYLDGERSVLRTRRHDVRPMQPNLRERMLRIAGDAMTATSLTVLSDRGDGTLDAETIRALVAGARQVGRRVVADLEQTGDAGRIAGCDVLIGLGLGADCTDAAVDARRQAACVPVSVLFLPEGELMVCDRDGIGRLTLPPSRDASGDYARVVAAVAASVATGRGARQAVRIAAEIIRRAKLT
jgi:D-beta-D-heptose 7-phosphate kinase/D-beta-D-heptose 1-phosphate adenosyltransferase